MWILLFLSYSSPAVPLCASFHSAIGILNTCPASNEGLVGAPGDLMHVWKYFVS